jgi:ATP-dependent DNA ligase
MSTSSEFASGAETMSICRRCFEASPADEGVTVFQAACSLGLEGIVSKRKDRAMSQDARRTGSR